MTKERFKQTISKALDNYWDCDWSIEAPGLNNHAVVNLMTAGGYPTTNTIELFDYSENSITIDFDRIKVSDIIADELEENWIFELSTDMRLEITFHKVA